MIPIDCSIGEGGGGVVRAAITAALLAKQPVHLTAIRPQSYEGGLGWEHARFVQAVARWTGSNAISAQPGSPELIFEPGEGPTATDVVVDFDDPKATRTRPGIDIVRQYELGSDRFIGPPVDPTGAPIRGHAITSPLTALLPVLMMHPGCGFLGRGGTEVAGAPFVDVVQPTWRRVAAELGTGIVLTVSGRGAIGIGGGRIAVRARSAVRRGATCEFGSPEAVDDPDVAAMLYVYGNEGYRDAVIGKFRNHVHVLAKSLSIRIDVRTVVVDYPVCLYQQLFLLKSAAEVRDITVCYEELSSHERASLEFGLAITRQRLIRERGRVHLMSRFSCEQLLPLLAITCDSARLWTERLTPHFDAVAHITARVVGRDILARRHNEHLVEITV